MKYLLIVVILAVAGVGIGYYLYNKPHQNMEQAAADTSLPATELLRQFQDDETTANQAYLDQVVQVSGQVESVSRDEQGHVQVRLQAGDPLSGVICQLDDLTEHERTDFSPGEQVTFKGLCTGMLMDVVLVRCVLVNS